MTQTLVIPSHIPWTELKQERLEELLFWLLDALGAKDLVWRRGGDGAGASDGGRDLEATFHTSTPDGEVVPERWWLEAKGRSGTLEKAAVTVACNNSTSQAHTAVLIIATNTQFSNPTRDWVTDWQRAHPRPRVRLWDRDALERMVCRYPSVVARLFSDALSPQGQLEMLTTRFWQQVQYPGRTALERLWAHREHLQWTSQTLLTVLCGEFANGAITERPWLSLLDHEKESSVVLLLDLGVTALANVAYFIYRSEDFGANARPILDATAYAIQASVLHLPISLSTRMISEPWGFCDPDRQFPDKAKDHIRRLVLQQVYGEVREACVGCCGRFTPDSEKIVPPDHSHFWRRFGQRSYRQPEKQERSVQFGIFDYNIPCAIGLPLGPRQDCPYLSKTFDRSDVDAVLAILKLTLEERVKQNAG